MSESNSWPLAEIRIFIFHTVILRLVNEVTVCCLPPPHTPPTQKISVWLILRPRSLISIPSVLQTSQDCPPLPPGLCHSYPLVFIPSLSQVLMPYAPAMSLTKVLFHPITYLNRIPKQFINTWKMEARTPRPAFGEYKLRPQTCSSSILLLFFIKRPDPVTLA